MAPADGSYRRLDLDSVDVSLVLDQFTVEGVVHTERGKTRFSDAWEALLHESRAFLPVTEARIVSHNSEASPDVDTDFMLVEKSDIRAAFPKDSQAVGAGTPRRIEVVPVEAALILDGTRVEGTIWTDPRKSRFSDAWESILSQPRSFIPVTKARMLTHDGTRVLAQTDFMLIEKIEVLTAYPLGQEAEHSPAWRRDDLMKVRMCVVLERMRVEGTVHVENPKARFERFSDHWEALIRDRRRYIPVTDARMTTVDGARQLGEADFMIFDKQEARAAFPLGE